MTGVGLDRGGRGCRLVSRASGASVASAAFFFGRGLLGRGDLLGLLGLHLAPNAQLIGFAAYTVGLGLLHARGVALHPDAELFAKVEELFVGEPQLLGQLVYSWVLGQRGSLTCPAVVPPFDRTAGSSLAQPGRTARSWF